MGLSGCYALMKYLVILLNLIFLVVGIAAVVIAGWMLADPTFYVSVAQAEADYQAGLLLLLAAGALLLIVAFLGCCGALRESQCMLVAFFSCLVVVLVGEAAATWWCIAQKPHFQQLVRNSVQHTVSHEYGRVDSRTRIFDVIQSQLECCGAAGPHDWAGSWYARSKLGGGQSEKVSDIILNIGKAQLLYTLPPSCCKTQDPIECNEARKWGITAPISSKLYSVGCMDMLQDIISDKISWLRIVAIVVAALQLLGLLFAACLACAVQRNHRYKA